MRGQVGTWSQEVCTATLAHVCWCVCPGRLDRRVQGGFARLHRSLGGVQGGLQQFRQPSLPYVEQVGGYGGPHWETLGETSRRAERTSKLLAFAYNDDAPECSSPSAPNLNTYALLLQNQT